MIYCDTARRYRKRGKKWSHVFSPDVNELKEFARRYGLKRFDSSPFPHYDVTVDEVPNLLTLGVKLLKGPQLLGILKECRSNK